MKNIIGQNDKLVSGRKKGLMGSLKKVAKLSYGNPLIILILY